MPLKFMVSERGIDSKVERTPGAVYDSRFLDTRALKMCTETATSVGSVYLLWYLYGLHHHSQAHHLSYGRSILTTLHWHSCTNACANRCVHPVCTGTLPPQEAIAVSPGEPPPIDIVLSIVGG